MRYTLGICLLNCVLLTAQAALPWYDTWPAIPAHVIAQEETAFEGRLPMAWPNTVAQGSTFHHKPSHFLGDIKAWQSMLNMGKAREVTVASDHPYPYGFGL